MGKNITADTSGYPRPEVLKKEDSGRLLAEAKYWSTAFTCHGAYREYTALDIYAWVVTLSNTSIEKAQKRSTACRTSPSSYVP